MSQLRKVTIELRPDGRWNMVREMDETADSWVCDDLHEAHDVVMAAFRPDGTPRWDGSARQLCPVAQAATGTGEEGKART